MHLGALLAITIASIAAGQRNVLYNIFLLFKQGIIQIVRGFNLEASYNAYSACYTMMNRDMQ